MPPIFSLRHNEHGALTRLVLNNDPVKMNWVIDPAYLTRCDYSHDDKLFGEFDIEFQGRKIRSIDISNEIIADDNSLEIRYNLNEIMVCILFKQEQKGLQFSVMLENMTGELITIEHFSVWASLAYIMFRDMDVHRNASQSAAIFPSVSQNYTRIAAVRRDNRGPHLGMFQSSGETQSIGTFNEFTNLFFENISPSLDGLLFHKLMLADRPFRNKDTVADWIYPVNPLELSPRRHVYWSWLIAPFKDADDYTQAARRAGHPHLTYRPMVQLGSEQRLVIQAPETNPVVSARDNYCVAGYVAGDDITGLLLDDVLSFIPTSPGEHKLTVTFADGTEDSVIFNVMTGLKDIIHHRLEYLSSVAYSGEKAKVPFSFTPLSVQGESLGKLNFILQAILAEDSASAQAEKIHQVEKSAVYYVRQKWFVDGDFSNPRRLYEDKFYRVLDFDYISHLFWLLSRCPHEVLQLETPETYLGWAADVLNLRCNPDLHTDPRGKAEVEMLGAAFLYVNELLDGLRQNGMTEKYRVISKVWEETINKLADNSASLRAAITEHYFDNAGFGPAAAVLTLSGKRLAAARYADLLEANIGFSNDFRSQNPDRWWEALSYMTHTLWGGIPAAAALVCGVELNRPTLVEAAYRAMAAIFYLYDWNATATQRKLCKGEAASTYSVAGPNLNRPDLSRNRFGQSIFATDGGIFARTFKDGYTGEDDWDCGEELVAWLQGFGQTTYVYQDKHGLHAVNGEITVQADGSYRIKSYAPYIRQYNMISSRNVFSSTSGEVEYNPEKDVFSNVAR